MRQLVDGGKPYRFGVVQRCLEDVTRLEQELIVKTKAVNSRIGKLPYSHERLHENFKYSCLNWVFVWSALLAIQEIAWKKKRAELQRRVDTIQGMNVHARELEITVQESNKRMKERLRELHEVFAVRFD